MTERHPETDSVTDLKRKTGIYIHFPFCVKKCNYCAFLSFNADESPRKEYTDALMREIELRAAKTDPETVIDTVYLGGGTPSVVDVSRLSLIMKMLRRCFVISPDAEITIEANPGTLGKTDRVTRTKLQAYRFMGVNRLSMGVQSMDNDRLHFLGRIHTAEDVLRDMRFAREAGFENINLDLIFSVPGETADDAVGDLEKILTLRPEHISCYSLQLEEGTPFGEMADRGELTEVPDDEDRGTYHRICSALKDAGFEHYEISNFARAGSGRLTAEASPYRSRHNSLYWDMSDYIGLGLGASGFASGIRYKNTADMDQYLHETGSGRLPEEEVHHNTPFDNISEAVFTGLRRREGISYEEALAAYARAGGEEPAGDKFMEKFWTVFSEAEEEAKQFCDGGFLEISNEGLVLTEQGIDISNRIMALFV